MKILTALSVRAAFVLLLIAYDPVLGAQKPFFEKYGVNVALADHEQVYERAKPEDGTYFVLSNSGELRY
jgi:hypothetical protein